MRQSIANATENEENERHCPFYLMVKRYTFPRLITKSEHSDITHKECDCNLPFSFNPTSTHLN